MKRFNLFGDTVHSADMADTVMVDPDTGYPVLTDVEHIPGCRGWCEQGRKPCSLPRICRTGTRLHRVVEIACGPSDDKLRSEPLSDREQWLAIAVVMVLGVAGAVAGAFLSSYRG